MVKYEIVGVEDEEEEYVIFKLEEETTYEILELEEEIYETLQYHN